jgi:NAD(P)-dependent dehydrogenase (short-subunit alcohol dehydrogenase family)
MSQELTGQRVVVMGGSSGIGEAAAAQFAADGAEVVVTGRSRERLDRAVDRIGGKATAYRMDGADQADNAVSPGVIETPWWDRVPAEQRKELFDGLAATTPAGRVGRADEVARAIRMLAGNGFVTGVVLECTGGATLPAGR